MGYVYKITNTVNNKAYIGISIHEPEKGRIKDHLSGRGNRVIANAVKKYGKDAFTYEILEANVFDEFLPDLEVAYIANFNTVAPHGYNLTYGGSHSIPSENTRRKMSKSRKGEKNSFYGKRHSEETLRKLSDAKKGENNPNFNRTFSEEHRRKLSRTLKGNRNSAGSTRSEEHRRKLSRTLKGRTFSEEHRRKLSKAKKGKPRSEEYLQKRRLPEYASAHKFFLSLPSNMSLKGKRKLLFAEFPDIAKMTIYKWVRKWTS